jgi:uncharacterized RDD family membrane protein YckC
MLYGTLYVSRYSDRLYDSDDEAFLNTTGYLLGITMLLGYYIVMEGMFQRTIGKMITGTRVVRIDGGRPSLGQVVGRTFARLIPFEAFSFLGGNGYPVGWHDSLSGTRVVRSRGR